MSYNLFLNTLGGNIPEASSTQYGNQNSQYFVNYRIGNQQQRTGLSNASNGLPSWNNSQIEFNNLSASAGYNSLYADVYSANQSSAPQKVLEFKVPLDQLRAARSGRQNFRAGSSESAGDLDLQWEVQEFQPQGGYSQANSRVNSYQSPIRQGYGGAGGMSRQESRSVLVSGNGGYQNPGPRNYGTAGQGSGYGHFETARTQSGARVAAGGFGNGRFNHSTRTHRTAGMKKYQGTGNTFCGC
jgi:hypothetical protein